MSNDRMKQLQEDFPRDIRSDQIDPLRQFFELAGEVAILQYGRGASISDLLKVVDEALLAKKHPRPIKGNPGFNLSA